MRNPEEYYFRQGYDAAKESTRTYKNPYNEGFVQYDWWNNGYAVYLEEMNEDE